MAIEGFCSSFFPPQELEKGRFELVVYYRYGLDKKIQITHL